MTGEVIVIFLAIAFVWAVLGPSPQQIARQPREEPRPPNKNYEEGEGGPPNVVNHRPKRKPKVSEEDSNLPADTFKQLMKATKEKKSNVKFE